MRKETGLPYSKSAGDFRRLDLFLPEGNAGGRGMLFIHGGGWKTGSREMWHYTAEHMCRQGYVCASCSYRLAPEHKFPRQIEDVRLAMAWLRSHAAELGCAPDRLAALGSSAGGHLAALLATIGPEDELGRTGELACLDTRPNAVVCDCPVTFLGHGGPAVDLSGLKVSAAIEEFLGGTEARMPEVYRAASPLERVTGREPPFLFVHGELDKTVLLEHSRAMAARLQAAGVTAEVVVVPNLAHGFAFHPNCPLHLEIYDRMKVFLSGVLSAKSE